MQSAIESWSHGAVGGHSAMQPGSCTGEGMIAAKGMAPLRPARAKVYCPGPAWARGCYLWKGLHAFGSCYGQALHSIWEHLRMIVCLHISARVYIYIHKHICPYIYIHKYICAKEGKHREHSPAQSPTPPECKIDNAMGLRVILHNSITNGLILFLLKLTLTLWLSWYINFPKVKERSK